MAKSKKPKTKPVLDDDEIEIEEPAPKSKTKAKSKVNKSADEDEPAPKSKAKAQSEEAISIDDLVIEDEPAEEPKPKTKMKGKTRASAEDFDIDDLPAPDPSGQGIDIEGLREDEPTIDEISIDDLGDTTGNIDVPGSDEFNIDELGDSTGTIAVPDEEEPAPQPKGKTKIKSKTRMADDEDAQSVDVSLDDMDMELDDAELQDVDAEAKSADLDLADEADEEEADAGIASGDDIDEEADAGIVSGDDIDVAKGSVEDEDEASAEESDQPKPPPTAKVSKLTLFLIILNWAVVPVFLFMAFADHAARTRNSYAAILNHVAVWGLPLKQEEEAASLSEQTRPVMRLTPDQLKTAFKSRKTESIGGDEFKPVEEPVPLRLRPSDITDELQVDLFGRDNPVSSLDDEITRLKELLPNLIKAKAEAVVKKAKDDDEKREIIKKTLLRIAWDIWAVRRLNQQITEAKGVELDVMVNEAVQRRLYYDILAPYNTFRPGDLGKFKIERISDLDSYKIEEFRKLLVDRFDSTIADEFTTDAHLGKIIVENKVSAGDVHSMKRDSVEKRQTIAFMMFALSQINVPILNEKLIPKGIERASTVCGFYEFTNSSIHYVNALRFLEQRQIAAIKNDRDGYATTDKDDKGAPIRSRTDGFVDDHENMVNRLVKAVEQIDTAKTQLEELKKQKTQAEETYLKRAQQHKDALQRLVKTRKTTQIAAEDLREKQNQLHEALIELSDAGTRNFELERQIRAIETRLMQLEPKATKKR